MNMRPSPTALDRLSSLASLGNSAPERRSPGHQRQPCDSGETPGLVQRCVIIQKDQHGFGFTVSGDRIVLVQSVRPGGAAMRAGVQEGDRIVKVNGTMVTNSSHLEVVKLIKSGAYVALTLLGSPPASAGLLGSQEQEGPTGGAPWVMPACPPPPPPPPLPPSQHITGPTPLQDPEVQKQATQILWNMLRQEEAELQRCYEVYSRNPASPMEEQIEGARRRVSQLQLKICQEMGGLVDSSARSASESGSIGGSRLAEGRLSLDSQDGDSGLDSSTERFPSVSEISLNRNSVLSDQGLESPPHASPIAPSRAFPHHRHQGSGTQGSPSSSANQSLDRAPRPLIIGPEEDCDPGYFNNECDHLFQDLGKLKTRPAHLGVFLRYIFSQADPSPLLLYLCVEVYQQMNPKEARALGKDIWHTFLEKAAPLRVKIPDQLLAEIDSRLRNGEDARNAFAQAQEAVMPQIQEQIQDYRTKRTLGLGSLYGENDLMDLDGEPQKERQVAEKQVAQLGDLLSKYEEERSAPMGFALNTYMSHVGLRPREAPRPVSLVEKAQEKDKWLPFFPKTKKSSSTKKEKESLVEDKKRNPILKYIGKPKSSSQSTFHVPLSPVEVKPGSVRNIIQHFESSQSPMEPQESGLQRLSTGTFPEGLLDVDSSRSEVKLGRSESLKGREELKRLRKAENVPRSRSDVDMEAAMEAARLHQSASSSASSLSARSLENPTPPYTPKMGRRSIESPNLGFSLDTFLPHLLEDDLGQLSDLDMEPDAQNWQHTVGREVVASLPQQEVDRQEVINELFVTEASHLRVLRVLDHLFYQRLKKESLLSRDELALLFPNLHELIEIHNSLSESMKRLREEGPVVKEVGDLMLSRFDGAACQELQQAAAEFCAYQSVALELIRTKKRKESRFQQFMQEAESSPQCRRLQLKDLILSEMQRLTKYPLLLDNLLKHTHGNTWEYRKLCRARDQCREILRYVNEAVKQAENQHRLEGYQKRLDATPLERTSNPLAAEFKNLDLRSRRMVHEGLLTWRITKDKTVDLHVLLLEDLLVLLQRQDERLVLKCHGKSSSSSSSSAALGSSSSASSSSSSSSASSDAKQTFSPVLKLTSVLIRSVATDKRALFIICTSELGPQIYELVASTSSEKKTWMEHLEEAVKTATHKTASPPKGPPSPKLPGPPPATSSLQEAELPPHLVQDSREEEEEEEEEGASDETTTDTLLEEQHPHLGGPEGRGSEEEEEKEEGPVAAGALPPAFPLEAQAGLPQEAPEPSRTPPTSPQEPLVCLPSLAESALEDVETLRRCLLQRFLARQEPDPELTPTASGPGPHPPWDVALPSHQEKEEEPPGEGSHPTQAPLGPPAPPLGWEEDGGSEAEAAGGAQGPEAEEGPFLVQEGQGGSGLQVVRKAEVEGSLGALPLQTDRTDAGSPEGNCFYVSLPADATGEPQAEGARSPSPPGEGAPLSPPKTLPPTTAPQEEEEEGAPPSAEACPGEGPPGEVELIFRTIEQLRVKLTRLKDVEMAHQRLLRVLSRAATASTAEGASAPLGEIPLPSPSQTSLPGPPQNAKTAWASPSPPASLAPSEPGQPPLCEDGPREVTL